MLFSSDSHNSCYITTSRTVSKVEACLDDRHVKWEFLPNFPVSGLREAEGIQVRLGANRAPKENVERYMQQMKTGAVFPAIVINGAAELVDGNTRAEAARRLGLSTIAAYRCPDLAPIDARALSVELNQLNGQAMTPKEIRHFVMSAVREGKSLDLQAYARMTGQKPARLKQWMRVEEAHVRAETYDLPTEAFALIPEPARAALAGVTLKAVFVAAAQLAIDARLNAKSLKEILGEANHEKSENGMLAVIAHHRELRSEGIAQLRAGFKPRQRSGSQARMHLSALTKFSAEDLIDVPADKAADTVAKMQRVYDELGEAIRRLGRVEPSQLVEVA